MKHTHFRPFFSFCCCLAFLASCAPLANDDFSYTPSESTPQAPQLTPTPPKHTPLKPSSSSNSKGSDVTEHSSSTKKEEPYSLTPQEKKDLAFQRARMALKQKNIPVFLRAVKELDDHQQEEFRNSLKGEAVAAYWQEHTPPSFTEEDVYNVQVLESLPKPQDTSLFDVWAAAHMVHFL